MEVRIPDQTLHQLRNNQHSFNEILNYSSPNEWESRIDCPMGSSGVNIYLSVTFLPTSATHRTILWAIGLGLSLYWLAVSDEPRRVTRVVMLIFAEIFRSPLLLLLLTAIRCSCSGRIRCWRTRLLEASDE